MKNKIIRRNRGCLLQWKRFIYQVSKAIFMHKIFLAKEKFDVAWIILLNVISKIQSNFFIYIWRLGPWIVVNDFVSRFESM